MWNPKNKINEQQQQKKNRNKLINTENKMVVFRWDRDQVDSHKR